MLTILFGLLAGLVILGVCWVIEKREDACNRQKQWDEFKKQKAAQDWLKRYEG